MLLQARSASIIRRSTRRPRWPRRDRRAAATTPGTFWYYNNWDFNVLGTIYEHATGTGIYDALDRQIAKPIGMQDYRPQDGTYFTGRTRSIAPIRCA